MRVFNNHGGNILDPIGNLDFERLAEQGLGAQNVDFYYGGEPNSNILHKTKRKRIFFTTEEQSHDLDGTNQWMDHCDEILTICPPSVTNRLKRKSCFFPFSERFIPTDFSKKVDVIYTGFAGGAHVDEIINEIVKFNYRFASFGGHPRITNYNVSYIEKINLIAKSKIYPLHNSVGNGTPQIKTRPFEAAFCKALILCKKDSWNIIEEWFEPNKEFLYYSNGEELNKLISTVLADYENYLPIIEAAHNKAVNNYTTRHFIEKYLS